MNSALAAASPPLAAPATSPDERISAIEAAFRVRSFAWLTFLPLLGLPVAILAFWRLWQLDQHLAAGWHPARSTWAGAVRIVSVGWLCSTVVSFRLGAGGWMLNATEDDVKAMLSLTWLVMGFAGGVTTVLLGFAAVRTRPRIAELAQRWRNSLLSGLAAYHAVLLVLLLNTPLQESVSRLMSAGLDGAGSSPLAWFAAIAMGTGGLVGVAIHGRWLACGCLLVAVLVAWLALR